MWPTKFNAPLDCFSPLHFWLLRGGDYRALYADFLPLQGLLTVMRIPGIISLLSSLLRPPDSRYATERRRELGRRASISSRKADRFDTDYLC